MIEPINYTIKEVRDDPRGLNLLGLECKNSASGKTESIILWGNYILNNMKFHPGQNFETWAIFGNPRSCGHSAESFVREEMSTRPRVLTAAKLDKKPAYMPHFSNNILSHFADEQAIDHRMAHYRELYELFDGDETSRHRISETLLFLQYSKNFLKQATKNPADYKKLLELEDNQRLNNHLTKWISCMRQGDPKWESLGPVRNNAMLWVLYSLVNERPARAT